jgi:predicted Zn-dependent peptidase
MPAPIVTFLILLAASLARGAEPAPAPGSVQDARPLAPDTVFRIPGGPTIAVFETGASETVSIRVAVPFTEAPGEAGVGQLLRVQAQARMEPLAARIGARAEVHRTPSALAYQVSGSVQDLDFLAWILREGMAAPEERRLEAARRQVRSELERRIETPEGTLALRLRASLAPGAPPLQGSLGTLDRVQTGHLAYAWARTHARRELRIVAAGRVDPTLLLAALADLGLPDTGPGPARPPPESTGEPPGDPEVIRHWTARAYRIDEHVGGQALVAARHLAELVRESPGDYEASVELWELGSGGALVVSGAAYDRSRHEMHTRVIGLLEEGTRNLDETRIRTLSSELRAELRLAGRSPWGLADLVGQAWDSGNGPDGAGRLLEELRRVEATDVRRLLEVLSGQSPVAEELRP